MRDRRLHLHLHRLHLHLHRLRSNHSRSSHHHARRHRLGNRHSLHRLGSCNRLVLHLKLPTRCDAIRDRYLHSLSIGRHHLSCSKREKSCENTLPHGFDLMGKRLTVSGESDAKSAQIFGGMTDHHELPRHHTSGALHNERGLHHHNVVGVAYSVALLVT